MKKDRLLLLSFSQTIWVVILFTLSFAGFSGCKKPDNPDPIEQKASYQLIAPETYPTFNADAAYQYIEKQVAFGPRVPNTEPHQKAKEFFVAELKKYADAVEEQNFSYPGYEGVTLKLTNIIARFNPSLKNRIFFCAHWDSRPRADHNSPAEHMNKGIPGANDGGSGVGILLELVRVLKEKKPDYGIDLILFDGEDYGKNSELDLYCLGSKFFAANAAGYNPAFGILLDLVGDKEAQFHLEQNSMAFAPEVMTMVWQIAAEMNISRFVQREGSAIYDDHIPLNQAGIKTIDIIDAELIGASPSVGRRSYWHTLNDTMENIGKPTLQDVGNVLTRLIYSLKFVQPAS